MVRGFKHEAWEAGQKKLALGHGGTLDPFAEGLLLVLAGQATRLMELMHPLPKTYLARLAWGAETDTCDHLGLVVAEGPAPSTGGPGGRAGAVPGLHDQIPPDTCAKKIDGEAAYKKAHRGEDVDLPPSRVYLHEAAWVSHDLPRSSLLGSPARAATTCAPWPGIWAGAWAAPPTFRPCRAPPSGPGTIPAPGRRTLIQGADLVPWCPARILDDAEATICCTAGRCPWGGPGAVLGPCP